MFNWSHKLPLMLAIASMLLINGCVASYQHQSDPRINNDGYDFICAGVEQDIKAIRLRGDVCHNFTPNGGEVIRASIEYRFDPRKF